MMFTARIEKQQQKKAPPLLIAAGEGAGADPNTPSQRRGLVYTILQLAARAKEEIPCQK